MEIRTSNGSSLRFLSFFFLYNPEGGGLGSCSSLKKSVGHHVKIFGSGDIIPISEKPIWGYCRIFIEHVGLPSRHPSSIALANTPTNNGHCLLLIAFALSSSSCYGEMGIDCTSELEMKEYFAKWCSTVGVCTRTKRRTGLYLGIINRVPPRTKQRMSGFRSLSAQFSY